MAKPNLTRVAPHTCIVCGAFFTPVKRLTRKNGKRFTAYTGAKTCSCACEFARMRQFDAARAIAIRAAISGPKNSNWKGGKACLSRGYHGPDWKSISGKARARDGYACQRCGVTQSEYGKTLHVHHIVPAGNFTDTRKANKLTNLVTLCVSCHSIVEADVWQVQIPLFNGIARHQRKGIRARGERVGGSKLTEADVVMLRAEYALGSTTREISLRYSLSQSSAWAAINGLTWAHISLPSYDFRKRTKPGPKAGRSAKALDIGHR